MLAFRDFCILVTETVRPQGFFVHRIDYTEPDGPINRDLLDIQQIVL